METLLRLGREGTSEWTGFPRIEKAREAVDGHGAARRRPSVGSAAGGTVLAVAVFLMRNQSSAALWGPGAVHVWIL